MGIAHGRNLYTFGFFASFALKSLYRKGRKENRSLCGISVYANEALSLQMQDDFLGGFLGG
jgi:hypothetical protein